MLKGLWCKLNDFLISRLSIPRIVVHGKYHNFRIVFLYIYFFVCVVLTCLLIYYYYCYRGIQVNSLSFIILSSCVFFLQALFSSVKFLFKFVFTLVFIHNFLLFVITFIPKTGFYKYNTGGAVFSTILSYSILLSSFTVVFLERCLC